MADDSLIQRFTRSLHLQQECWHRNISDTVMRILVTNDDSIYSPGIAALARVASRFGEVRVVAPDVEQSSMGQALHPAGPCLIKNHPCNLMVLKLIE